MTFENETVAVGAISVVAVLIWSTIQIWKRMRAIDAQITKMQKEIDILQMHESRRLMMDLKTNSKVEGQKINPDNGPVETGDVVRLIKTPPTTPAQ